MSPKKRKIEVNKAASSSSSGPERKSKIRSKRSLKEQNLVHEPVLIEEPVSSEDDVFSKLPVEIVFDIIKRVPATERSNIRLVCKEWYYACENDEKLSIGPEYSGRFDEFLSIVRKSARQCLHLEFSGVHFREHPQARFWIICGSRILSLKFKNCGLSRRAFTFILKNCSKLETLAMHFYFFKDIGELKDGVPRPASDLKNLSLKTFEIRLNDLPIFHIDWIFFLRFFFDSFPNIVNFSFCHGNPVRLNRINVMNLTKSMDTLNAAPNQETIDERRVLREYLNGNQMRSIKMNFLPLSFLLGPLAMIQFSNFTEITAWEIVPKSRMLEFIKFTEKQVILRKLTCITNLSVPKQDLDLFVTRMLKIATLREFNLLLCGNNIEWDTNWSTSLNESNVRTLSIVGTDICFPNTSNTSHPRNEKLTTLVIRENITFDSSVSSFLETLPNLRALYLSHVDSEMFKSICANQVKLESLVIEKVIDGIELMSTAPFNRLERLRKLILPLKNFISKENHFDNLKMLCVTQEHPVLCEEIHCRWRENYLDSDSLQMYRNLSSSFEVLWIENFYVQLPCLNDISSKFKSHKEWFLNLISEFISDMKNLKLLYLDYRLMSSPETACDDNFTAEEVESFIFRNYPSLRIFVYHDAVFVKNLFTKSIERSASYTKCHLKKWRVSMKDSFE